MAFGLGVGKPRTRLGKLLDRNGLTQLWLMKKTGLGENTIYRLCNDKEYRPYERTKILVVSVLQNEVDPHVSISDLW